MLTQDSTLWQKNQINALAADCFKSARNEVEFITELHDLRCRGQLGGREEILTDARSHLFKTLYFVREFIDALIDGRSVRRHSEVIVACSCERKEARPERSNVGRG